jgi:hypothetical protein
MNRGFTVMWELYIPLALPFKKLILTTMYLCVPYDSQNKQRLISQTALTGQYYGDAVFPVRYELTCYILF